MSPPQPLFPFQSFTKNFFSSFYNFFSPHICTSITRPGNGRPRESCDLRSCRCPGEEKGSVCQKPFSWASWEVRGWLDADPAKPRKSQPTFTQSFPLVCCFLTPSLLRSSLSLPNVKAWGWLPSRNLPVWLASLNIGTLSTSPQQGSELDIDWGAVLMHPLWTREGEPNGCSLCMRKISCDDSKSYKSIFVSITWALFFFLFFSFKRNI